MEPSRTTDYIEAGRGKDVLYFGFSNRESVLFHESQAGKEGRDDVV